MSSLKEISKHELTRNWPSWNDVHMSYRNTNCVEFKTNYDNERHFWPRGVFIWLNKTIYCSLQKGSLDLIHSFDKVTLSLVNPSIQSTSLLELTLLAKALDIESIHIFYEVFYRLNLVIPYMICDSVDNDNIFFSTLDKSSIQIMRKSNICLMFGISHRCRKIWKG